MGGRAGSVGEGVGGLSRHRIATLLASLALSLAAASLTGADGGAASSDVGVEATPPNFVLVYTDDQRWDTIGRCLNGFDGGDLAAGTDACMPHLQTDLVANGHTFLRGYATTAVCCPSRASVLTGLYSRHTGVTKNSSYPAFDESSTVATWLSGAGYRAGFVGKYLNGYGQKNRDGTMPDPHVPPGWDTWHAFWDSASYLSYSVAESDAGAPVTVNSYDNSASTSGEACAPGNFYQTDLICRRALDFVAADASAPFLLYFWPSSPHLPATPPTRWSGLFGSVTNPRYPNYDQIPSPNPPKWLKTDPLTDKDHDRITSQFRAQLEANRAVDDAVHALSEQLAADGRLANTVFVFTSDNGYARGEHRHEKKACEYEECHRVPFVVACPPAACSGAAPGTVDAERIALNIDIPVTFADLAGVMPPFTVDGRSLAPLINGTTGGRSWFTIDDDEPYVAKIDGVVSKEPDGHSYKYVVLGNQEFELYDLTADPWELTNLAGDAAYADVQGRLAERLAQALVAGPGAAMLTALTAGEGTVTTTPSGVSCPSDCWEVYAHATEVTLQATPASGWIFAEWTGACSGAAPTCTVAMTEDTTVTATFTSGSPPP